MQSEWLLIMIDYSARISVPGKKDYNSRHLCMPTHLERIFRTGAKNLSPGLLQQAKFILIRAVRVEIYGIISDESEARDL